MIRRNKVYQEMAGCVGARTRCRAAVNNESTLEMMKYRQEWADKHEDRIYDMLGELPHGSGIDYDWQFDWDKSTENKIVFSNAWHYMDGNGYYDGVYDFTVTVKPDLQFGFDLHINFHGMPSRKKENIEDYLYAILRDALHEQMPGMYACTKCRQVWNEDQMWEYIFHQCEEATA